MADEGLVAAAGAVRGGCEVPVEQAAKKASVHAADNRPNVGRRSMARGCLGFVTLTSVEQGEVLSNA